MSKGVYLAVAVALVVFGSLALFSIGFPFLLTGMIMLLLAPMRHRTDLVVPAVLWPWFFTAGYVLVGPLGCSQVTTLMRAEAVEGMTRCHGLLVTYTGRGDYSPPLLPALLFGAVLATGLALGVRRILTRPRRRAPRSTIGSAT